MDRDDRRMIYTKARWMDIKRDRHEGRAGRGNNDPEIKEEVFTDEKCRLVRKKRWEIKSK